MSEALRQLIGATQSKFKAEPESAAATFESRSALQEGLRSEVAVREHKLVWTSHRSSAEPTPGPIRWS